MHGQMVLTQSVSYALSDGADTERKLCMVRWC